MNETKIAALGDIALDLGKLKEQPGWGRLREIFKAAKERYERRLGRRMLMRGAEVNQREIDYQAGFFAGAQWILDNPEQAEATLERALRQAEELR